MPAAAATQLRAGSGYRRERFDHVATATGAGCTPAAENR